MAHSSKEIKIGYFLKRNDISHIDFKILLLEIHMNFFEAKIMQKTITSFLNLKLIDFDSTIGDRKCQTRTSRILDLANHYKQFCEKLHQEENIINQIIDNIKFLLKKISDYTQNERIELIKILKTEYLSSFFEKNNFLFKASEELTLLSLSYLATLSQKDLNHLMDETITPTKIKKIINHQVKSVLCLLSIEYERELARNYDLKEIAQCLQQTEKKGFCEMTAFYPSFKAIIEKMKYTSQSFAKKTTHFCFCGGVKENSFELFSFKDHQWIKNQDIAKNPSMPIMVIYGFQFQGSFTQLKNILHIPQEEVSIPKSYHRPCLCKAPLSQPIIDHIEEAILSNFAHHSQFTTDAEIHWQALGLQDSNLKKEYEYLKTLSGYSADDMSKFCINHIYAATVQDALEQDSPSIINNVSEHRKQIIVHTDHAHCPC
ncbi:hypothetical protein HYV11_01080 [Candidatus Dependentiae bacterium]|nr:hypothetical protein [Candidatus Dependentiae bacterium]